MSNNQKKLPDLPNVRDKIISGLDNPHWQGYLKKKDREIVEAFDTATDISIKYLNEKEKKELIPELKERLETERTGLVRHLVSSMTPGEYKTAKIIADSSNIEEL